MIWLAHSNIATRKALRAQASSQHVKIIAWSSSSRKCSSTIVSPPKTPMQLRLSEVRNSNKGSSSSSTSGRHSPFGVGRNVDGRNGCVSTPGYQTPSVNNAGRRNFSSLAKTAPVSYGTLQHNGLLDAMSTPTRKFSPSASIGNSVTTYEEYVQVYDSPTRSWGNVERLKVVSKEAPRKAEAI
ncbi:hypothetical protein E8E12_004603 [Didymella heteroderae]|uniref:Uncharacterized protein n=1 Tax=Didymella heteroderae TaxID=1769908 RepID=A0A9P5BWM3_9PLEO|nr:hypothetical protein E8E12_004603 [Didymella heteroderae]